MFAPIVCHYYKSADKNLVDEDITRWCKEHSIVHASQVDGLTKLMFNRTFRTVLYFRLRNLPRFVRVIYKPDKSFFISPACNIDGGLFFWHPLSTYLYARHIGRNVTIRQLTTLGNLGKKDVTALADIGDNVDMGVNVTIIGNVKIGDNVKIGAGAVITKDVPDDCTVVGNPAYIIRQNGMRCRKIL